jgi:hypothetical protein
MSSYAFDYVTRQKMGGLNMSFYIVQQLPIHLPAFISQPSFLSQNDQPIISWLLPRILELTYTAWDLESFAQDCGWPGPPFRWNEERRFLLRCELDAAFFHFYLSTEKNGDWHETQRDTEEELERLKASFPTPRDAVAYMMETFPIMRERDEEKYDGDYRTKRVILEIYDAMQESIRTGQPYQTRLEPPPADPRCCHARRKNNKP